MVESLSTLNEEAAVPPKETAVAPVKPVPLICIVYPLAPEVGEKERTLGGAEETKVKPAKESTPPEPVTAMWPLAPLPTTAVMAVELTRLKERAATPPKVTAVIPLKSVPRIVTVWFLRAEAGEKELTSGVGVGMKLNPARVAVPPGVVTTTLPLAPVPTTAVILVVLLTQNSLAATAPNVTEVAPLKLVPLMTTICSGLAEVGLKEVIVGTEEAT
jgi:hypothetical protein